MYAAVVGQDEAVDLLRRAGRDPMHAYMIVGPQGSGRTAAGLAFAAQVLCPVSAEGCGECRSCRLALAEKHPDLHVARRSKPAIGIGARKGPPEPGTARWIVNEAVKSPNEGERKVIMVPEFEHVSDDSVATLLKTLEEPSASTVLLLLADRLRPEFVTITSRCTVVELASLSQAMVEQALLAEGADPQRAAEVAGLSGGDLAFARVLVDDAGAAARREMWWQLPGRLDGTGHTASLLVDELRESLDLVADSLLAGRHAAERAELERRIAEEGLAKGRLKELDEQHKQERRRVRTAELWRGLATLASRYRDAVVETAAAGDDPSGVLRAHDELQAVGEAIERNPNETLQLLRLLLRLPPLPMG